MDSLIELTSSELKLVTDLITSKLSSLGYTQFNTIEVIDNFTDKSNYKYVYSPFTTKVEDNVIYGIKRRGIFDMMNDPIFIQEKISATNRDRFTRVPGVVLGTDGSKVYFYKVNSKTEYDLRLKVWTAFQFPNWKSIWSLGGLHRYHIYTPTNPIHRYHLGEKKYANEIQSWLQSDVNYYLDVIKDIYFYSKFMIKGMLITYNYKPDVIVTMSSHKDMNKKFLDLLKSDPYFANAEYITVNKPSSEEILSHYRSKYRNSSEVLDEMTDDRQLYMKIFSASDRYLYSKMCNELISGSIPSIENKTVMIFDDSVTSGSTIGNIIIPLFENKNNIVLPFSMFGRG